MSSSRRIGKTGTCFFLGIVASAAILLGSALFQFWLFLRLPGNPAREMRQVTLQPGMNAVKIARLLQTEGVISDARKFAALCWLRRSGHRLQAGEYAFLPLSTPDQILDQMVSGRVLLTRVTLPEGSTVRDVARILEEKGLASQQDILRLAEDTNTIREMGLQVSSLEGYLFPETYDFKKSQTEVAILKTMVDQFRRHLPDAWQQQAAQIGFSLHDVVIMASIVEKEAVVDSERPLIAAVFFNRLKLNMPLQSDPTTVYDLTGFSGRIGSAQLQRQSAYNTYKNRGLPVGPICNPGAKSIQAVLYPEKVPYLYFVSNSDGSHHFSGTLAEHNQAVSRYREKRKAPSEAQKPAFHSDFSTHGIGILERRD